MTLEGVVRNGVIVPDGPPPPEGARVRWIFADDDFEDIPPVLTGETREEFLASLRQSIADAKSGINGMTLAAFEAELKQEYGDATETAR